MITEKVRACWNKNADTWTLLARAGYDVYRDFLNTPAFMKMLPPVEGLVGLDIGCGEGENTRKLAARGAKVHAIDISHTFVKHAKAYRPDNLPGIDYATANALQLPFADSAFDFVTGIMSFMDIPKTDLLLSEVFRVLRRNGFCQFSITHPFLNTPHHKNLRGDDGLTYAYEIGGYFQALDGEISEWIFSTLPSEQREKFDKFQVPRFTHTLSQWFTMLLETGFVIEAVGEPYPDDDTVRCCPAVQDAQIVPYFLHVRVRKPGE